MVRARNCCPLSPGVAAAKGCDQVCRDFAVMGVLRAPSQLSAATRGDGRQNKLNN